MVGTVEGVGGGRGGSVALPPARRRVLYLTFDGVLEPLGRSQVLRYLEGLAERGLALTLVSLERESDLLDPAAVAGLEGELSSRGIRWIRLPYRRGGPWAMLRNCRAAHRAVRRAVEEDRIGLVHARAHVPATIAWRIQRSTGVPYIFDMRGYWIEEKRAEGSWFTNPVTHRAAGSVERSALRAAAGVVTLTEILAQDLRAGPLAGLAVPVTTIGTCADFDEFTPDADPGLVPREVRERLAGKLVVVWVGAVNVSYYVAESLRLFRLLRERRPDAHLLCITRQTEEIKRRIAEAGIAESDCSVQAVPHRAMKSWLAMAHWGLLLVTPTYSKRGAMPTKLAEFLASGVRPIQYGCNDDVTRLVREAGSGLVLEGVSDEHLRQAAARIGGAPLDRQQVLRAREFARSRLGLEVGVARYADLIESIFAQSEKARGKGSDGRDGGGTR